MENKRFVPGDSTLIENIVSYLKAKGIFDEFRHECLADVDTKSSCQNLSQRIDGYATKFLSNENWNPDLNKNELRNKLRRNIDESGMLAVGADHVVEQVINPKISLLFLPKIIEVVHQYLKEENEKCRKQESVCESVSLEKPTTETVDGASNKSKTPIIDPIADILSFTYSKPKTISSNNALKSETVLKKGGDNVLKIDKKKEDVILQIKSADVQFKVEKKEEEINQAGKNAETPLKSETKENIQVKTLDITFKVEKPSEEISPLIESNESSNENMILDTKTLTEVKESKLKKDVNSEDLDLSKQQNELKEVKIRKEIKNEEAIIETQKKVQKDEIKLDKKKLEDSKIKEEMEENKPVSAHKTSSHNKPKSELEKSKKTKIHSSQKSQISDLRSSKSKETSNSKTQFDKQSKPMSSKTSKPLSKELSPSLKSGSSKPLKKEKTEDESVRNRSVDSNKVSISSLKKSSSKPSTSKMENVPSKNKHMLDKTEKEKSSMNQSVKTKINIKALSSSNEKSKNNIQSSSYESSQSSDLDKSHSSATDSLKKQKHYSKHHKKESSEKSSSHDQKSASNIKRSHSASDSSFSKKQKSEKNLKTSLQKKLKETTLSQESAKISSRSNSFGSTSSTSDSSNVCKDSLPSSSEDTSESSTKSQEKKKKLSEKDRCSTSNDFPPPPPPPPPPSDSVVTDSVSSSPDNNTTQSSQESESEVESSNVSDSDSDDDNSSSGEQTSGHNSEAESSDASDIYDVLLYSSSSSEFEGFCSSPERNKRQSSASNTSVSSVHTSDLSSYEDEISVEDLSFEDFSQLSDQRIKRKFTVKEAQELLRNREAQKRSHSEKAFVEEKDATSDEDKASHITTPTFVPILSSEEEVSPQLEPRRELRRERKLNPKYASNEYTSIFNSKRTSFITKNMNHSPQKQIINTSVTNSSKNIGELVEEKSKENTLNDCISNQNFQKKTSYSNLSMDSPFSSLNEAKSFKVNKSDTDVIVDLNSNIKTSSNLQDDNLANKLTFNVNNSSISKSVPKELNPNGIKRKFDGSDKLINKRLCRRDSVDSNSSRSIANENKPFNRENINKSVHPSIDSRNNLPKQKANGDVLGRIDRLRSSQQKSNCTSGKN